MIKKIRKLRVRLQSRPRALDKDLDRLVEVKAKVNKFISGSTKFIESVHKNDVPFINVEVNSKKTTKIRRKSTKKPTTFMEDTFNSKYARHLNQATSFVMKRQASQKKLNHNCSVATVQQPKIRRKHSRDKRARNSMRSNISRNNSSSSLRKTKKRLRSKDIKMRNSKGSKTRKALRRASDRMIKCIDYSNEYIPNRMGSTVSKNKSKSKTRKSTMNQLSSSVVKQNKKLKKQISSLKNQLFSLKESQKYV